ncbi:MAG: hypothetical protein ACPGJV_03415 [Bacteriovoracaceae bacterium]
MRRTLGTLVISASLAFSSVASASATSALVDIENNLKEVIVETGQLASNAIPTLKGSASNRAIVGTAQTVTGTLSLDGERVADGLENIGEAAVKLASDTGSLAVATVQAGYDSLNILDENTAAHEFIVSVGNKLDDAIDQVDDEGFNFVANKLAEITDNDPVVGFVLVSSLKSMGDASEAGFDAAGQIFIKSPFSLAKSAYMNLFSFAKGFTDGSYDSPKDVLKAVAQAGFNIIQTAAQEIVNIIWSAVRFAKEAAEIVIGEKGAKLFAILEFIGNGVEATVEGAGNLLDKIFSGKGTQKKFKNPRLR